MGAVYSNTLARIRAGDLLTREKYARLADADYLSALRMLADYGYGGGETGEDSDKVIVRETDELIRFIEEDSADADAARALLCRFSYSNAKVLYKSRFTDVGTDVVMYGVSEDLSGITSGDYSDLSETMRSALEELDTRETPDPRVIDAALTRARYKEALTSARRSGSRTLIRCLLSEIDFSNILSVFRANALKMSADLYEEMFIPGGSVALGTLNECIGAEPSVIEEKFERTPYFDAVADVCEKGYGRLSAFETAADNYIYALTDAGAGSLDKFDGFLRYVLARLTEFKMVKLILTCIKNGARAEIAERMRYLDD